ncbi:MAG: Na/Pi cotransporter family protein [Oscillospiraceae bacterium]|nr:Na/Pi cotransporter family protein [Oscillospiraceae bacterium]
MDIFSVLTMIGGLALFLYGMKVMSSGLEKVSVGKLEKMLEKMTNTPVKGVLLGTIVTALIQSSSAVTVMVVGFVNSGIMKLSQATGVIMGASIGTTFTAWILSLAGIEGTSVIERMFKPESFAPVFAIIGVILVIFSKRDRRKNVGLILAGFAILMFGMTMMSSSVSGLSEIPEFKSILTMFGNPVLGVLVGIVFTAIIQSSSAAIGILQALSMTGAISYFTAIPIILGCNIGACAPAIISSIGAKREAKRAAFIHLYFKIIGTVLWFVLFGAANMIFKFEFIKGNVNPNTIAIIHTAFNIVNMLALFPFSKGLEKLARITIRETDSEKDGPFIDERFLNTPSFAVNQCKNATIKMATIAKKSIFSALALVEGYTEEVARQITESESQLDEYEDKLGTYLVKLSSKQLSENDSKEISRLLHSIGNFERIGDHALNIMESAREMYEKKLSFSENAKKELAVISGALREIIDISFESFIKNDSKEATKVEPLEQVIDSLKDTIKDRHIQRLQNGQCTIELGFILSDLLINYERVSDHCSNIAVCVIQIEDSSFDTHMYLNNLKESHAPQFVNDFKMYQGKYNL